MKEQSGYTQLLPLIQQCLIEPDYESCEAIESRVFTKQLYFNIVGKGIGSYLSDLAHSIQLQCANQKGARLERSPVNSAFTNYYFIYEKQWHAFNCHQRILDDSQNAEAAGVHPYQPQFHFGKDFADFCDQKSKAKNYFLPCRRIRISKWRCRIVNVSRSGWYAPLLEAIDYSIEQHAQKEDFAGVSCLIYEDAVRTAMERLRLQDMRASRMSRLGHEEQQISMLYFLKDAKPLARRKTNIYAADQQQALLVRSQSPRVNYVLFGEADGLLALKEPMGAPAMREDRIRVMSMENWQLLFNKGDNVKQEKGAFVWSSDEEEERDHAEALGDVVMIDESEESDEQQDPLRSIYLKQFTAMGLIN